MSRSGLQHAVPLAVLLFFILLDLAAGRDQQVLSLVVITPVVAATLLGRRATAAYGLAALVVAALLGIYDHQYTAENVLAQTIRLFGVALGGVIAVIVCSLRLRREEELARLSAQEATTRTVVQVAELLQRSLLGDPPRVPGLETAARYLPATRHAQVGGDWYDAFTVPDGTTMLVIGDVAGHDAPAAATMAQARGMLRAIAQFVVGSPAAVLRALDRTLANLGLDTLVTATVATVDVRPAIAGEAPVRLCWSNAGHPPPVLVTADGDARVLEHAPERLLGVGADVDRADHKQDLSPGDTVLFYTDGLIERRAVPLDQGTAWLVGELREIGREPLDRLCDGLIAAMGQKVDDDVALLAVRVPAHPRPDDVHASAARASVPGADQ